MWLNPEPYNGEELKKSVFNDPSRTSAWEKFQKQKNVTIKQRDFKEVLILGKNNTFPPFES